MYKAIIRSLVVCVGVLAIAFVAHAATYPLKRTFNYNGYSITKTQISESKKFIDDTRIIIGSLFLKDGSKTGQIPTPEQRKKFADAVAAYDRAYKDAGLDQSFVPDRFLPAKERIAQSLEHARRRAEIMKRFTGKMPIYGVEFFGSRPTATCGEGFALSRGLCTSKNREDSGKQTLPTCMQGYTRRYLAAKGTVQCIPQLEVSSERCPQGFYSDAGACYPYRRGVVCPKAQIGKDGLCHSSPEAMTVPQLGM